MQIFDRWLRDLPQQFQGKKNIEVIIKAFSRQLQELEQVMSDINAMTDLNTATGQNLDFVGSIVSLTRKEAGELAGIIDNEPDMSDERYRQYLKYKNLVNTNECTYYDLMDGLALLWDVSPIYYIEDPVFPATIILTMPFLKNGGETVLLGEVPMVKPAGVRIVFQYLIKYAVETRVIQTCTQYDIPLCGQILCGQHPHKGTVGKIMMLQNEVEIKETQKLFEHMKTGTFRCGAGVCKSKL